ncbi:MAG TPA: alpha/beta fold hydrolase [Actinomycetota bacterium]|nr:alpha/beta fold hydrolase [Actinomycetota bacterium]
MIRRVALAGAAVAALLAWAPDAHAQASYTAVELRIEGVPGPAPATGPRACTGPGGSCMLSATLFLPEPLPTEPVPAVLSPHGFPGHRGVEYVRKAAELLASQGYVVLTWDARGFGTSQGYVMLDHPDYEGADVSKVIDHLATLPQVQMDGPGDPRVGMYGQSYGGAIQFLAAARDRRIDALVARETWHDLRYSLVPNGIVKYQYTSLLFAGGQAATNGNLSPQLADWYARAVATNTGPPDLLEELRIRSPVAYAGRIEVPTFILQGARDTLFNLVESQRNVDMLVRDGVPTKLLWYWGGHGGYTMYPDRQKTWAADDPLEQRQLAWLDRHLRGDADVDTGPAFEYFDEDGQLRSSDRLPPIASVDVELGRPGQTMLKPPGRTCPPTGAPTCSYTETSNYSAPGQPFANQAPYDAPGAFLNLDTAPLEQALPVVGNPVATFSVTTATGQPVSLFLKIFDVAEDGSARLINRLVTPVRASPGQTYTIDMAGFAYTFDPGHRIRLTVATTDAAYFGTDPADQVTLGSAVSLRLPVSSADLRAPRPELPARLPEAGGPELPATGGGAWAGVLLLILARWMRNRRRA